MFYFALNDNHDYPRITRRVAKYVKAIGLYTLTYGRYDISFITIIVVVSPLCNIYDPGSHKIYLMSHNLI